MKFNPQKLLNAATYFEPFKFPKPSEKKATKQPEPRISKTEILNWDDPLQIELRKMNNHKLTIWNRSSKGLSYKKRLDLAREVNDD